MVRWHDVYLGLGSNLSDPEYQLKQAVQLLSDTDEITVLSQAPLYQTPAWGFTDQPDFINSALHILTTLTPTALLTQIKHIEYDQMGRIKNDRWHQRLIDIDILLFDDLEFTSEKLTIPHPLIAERWFVILPLLSLNPKLPPALNQAIEHRLKTDSPPKEIIILS